MKAIDEALVKAEEGVEKCIENSKETKVCLTEVTSYSIFYRWAISGLLFVRSKQVYIAKPLNDGYLVCMGTKLSYI